MNLEHKDSLGARDTIYVNSDLPELGCAILQGISTQTQQLVMLMHLFPNCLFMYLLLLLRASQVAQWVKHLPAMLETQEMQVQSLHWEDRRRRAWQPTLVLLLGGSQGQRSLAGLQSIGSQRAGHD